MSTDSETSYPPIVRGASLLLAYRLEGKRVLLVGGGAVAASRLGFLLEAGAHVTVISPTLEKSMQYRLDTEAGSMAWVSRAYGARNPEQKEATADDVPVSNTALEVPQDVELGLSVDTEYPLHSFDMVFTAIDDNALSRAICWACRLSRVPVNVADVPPECDFYFGAQVRRGPLQVMVSTSGAGPKVAVMVRDELARAIPDDVEDAIAGVGELRKELRILAPGVGGPLSKKRMRWMIDTCNLWSISEMGALNDPEIRRKLLKDGWEKGVVLGPRDVGTAAPVAAAAGASEGWSVRDMVNSVIEAPATVPALLGFVGGLAAAFLVRQGRRR